MQATLICGDVHGCIEELDELVRTVGSGVRVVGVGDLVDRGPDPVGVVRRFRENRWSCTLGNHDNKAVRWLRHEDIRKDFGTKNPMGGMREPRKSEWEALSHEDRVWVSNLPRSIMLPGTMVVHAGLEPGLSVLDQDPEKVMCVRNVDSSGRSVAYKPGTREWPDGSVHWAEMHKLPFDVVYGHSTFPDVRQDHNGSNCCWGMDTGCVYGGKLSGLFMHDGGIEVVSVPAKRKYFEYAERMND